MALGSDILRLIIDADSSGAVSEFKKLGKGIEDAGDKASTGFKGSLTKAFDGLQQKSPMVSGIFDKIGMSSSQAAAVVSTALPAAAAVAGAAIGKFALDGVSKFGNLGIAVEKFATSSGLSVDQASRWIEVAGDLGISSDTISAAFGKMEKAIGTNRAAFGDLVKTSKDGSVDLTATFLAATTHLQGISDPIQRATESAKLFGKGYKDVAQVLGMDAADIKKRLEGVADVKVFTPEKIAAANKYRDAMNDFRDSIEEAQLELGQHLLPQIAKLAKLAASAIKITVSVGTTGTGVGDVLDPAALAAKGDKGTQEFNKHLDSIIAKSGKVGEALKVNLGVGNFDAIARSAAEMGAAMGPAATSVGDFARASQDATSSANNFGGSADAVAQNLGHETDALRAANDALAAHTNAQLAAFDATFAVTNAQNDFAKAHMDATVASQDATKSAGELQMAYDAEAQMAVRAAEAVQAKYEKDVIASGGTVDLKKSNDLLISTLSGLATQASGPTKAALDTLIGALKDTGAQQPKPTVTLVDNASGPLVDVKGKVDGLDGARATISVGVSVNDSALTSLRNRLNSASASGAIPGGPYFFKRGGMVPGSPNQAHAAIVHGGEYVLPASVVDAIKGGRPPTSTEGPSHLPVGNASSGGNAIVINFNGLVTDEFAVGREIKRVLAKSSYSGVS